MTSEIVRWVAACIVILAELVLMFNLFMNKSSKLQMLIKDISAQEEIKDASYSYSRTQLMWWTFIVITCCVVDIALTGEANGIMNTTSLTLIGISAGTTVAGRVIDNSQSNDSSVTMHQDHPSEGFWMDILSDQNGVSIHRFQALLFNLAFGFAFISQFITSIPAEPFGVALALPAFDSTTLGLIGISSATYVTLKFNENLGSSSSSATGTTTQTSTPTPAPTTPTPAPSEPATPAAPPADNTPA